MIATGPPAGGTPVLGAAGDVEHRVADHAGQDTAYQGAGVARGVDVAVVQHGVAPAAAAQNTRRFDDVAMTSAPVGGPNNPPMVDVVWLCGR